MASGMYGLTLEKLLKGALSESYEAEDNKVMLTTNTYSPDYNAHDFRDDVTNEVVGTGYTAGGAALTGTEVTIATNVLTFDATDLTWAGASITARKLVHYFNVGSAATDALGLCLELGADVTSSGGNWTAQWHASGLYTISLV